MKKSKLFLTLATIVASLGLTGCANTQEAEFYGVDQFAQVDSGYVVSKIDVKVNNGKFVEMSTDAVYSPMVWAKLDSTDAETLGEDNVLKIDDKSYAKYIFVNDRMWTGSLRSSDDRRYEQNELIRYAASTDSNDASFDLWNYLSVNDSGVYKLGSRCKQYYNDVVNNNIAFYTVTITPSSGEGENPTYNYSKSTVTPKFAGDKKLRSQDTENLGWKRAFDAVGTFFKGKAINYMDRYQDLNFDNHNTLKVVDGVYNYNHQLTIISQKLKPGESDASYVEEAENNGWEKIEGCKFADIKSTELDFFFYGINQAFASVEYLSM